jgi:uncharacterized protein (DUF362 family)
MIGIVDVELKPQEKLTESLFKLLDMLQYRPSKPTILLKPNIVDAVPAWMGVITDPAFIEGLVLVLAQRGAKHFVIGENSGFYSMKEESWHDLVQQTKYIQIVKRIKERHNIDIELVNLDKEPHEPYTWKFGTLQLPSLLRTCSYINVPKMKTHSLTGITICCKNQKGLLHFQDKRQFHLGYDKKGDLHECIRELAKLIQPELNVVDATTALEGFGPWAAPEGQSKVRKLNLAIAGSNMMEVDTACCKIMGIPTSDVLHLTPTEINLAPGSHDLQPAIPPFLRPQSYVKFENLYVNISQWACTNCQLTWSRMLRKTMAVPEIGAQFRQLQQQYPRIDVFMGQNIPEDKLTNEYPKFFMGNCTKAMAEKLHAPHAEGCPPNHNQVLQKLFSTFLKQEK